MSDTLSLSDLPRTLREITGVRKSYQTLWRKVADGDLPAVKNAAGHWMIKREDVENIADTLTEGN